MFDFLNNSKLEKLPKEEAKKILSKYSDRVPVIVQKNKNDDPDIDKNKFIVPRDLTMGQFQYVIRKRLRLSPEKGLFLYVGGTVITSSELMTTVYETYCSDNLFLYVRYGMENVFG